jgi:chitinase
MRILNLQSVELQVGNNYGDGRRKMIESKYYIFIGKKNKVFKRHTLYHLTYSIVANTMEFNPLIKDFKEIKGITLICYKLITFIQKLFKKSNDTE